MTDIRRCINYLTFGATAIIIGWQQLSRIVPATFLKFNRSYDDVAKRRASKWGLRINEGVWLSVRVFHSLTI